MWNDIRSQPRSLVYSILLHLVVLGFMVFGLSWQSTPEIKPNVDIVQATIVDERTVQAEIDKLKKAEQKKKKAAEASLKKIEKARRKEERRLASLRKKQAAAKKADKARQAKLKKEQAALERKSKEESKRLAALKDKRKQAEQKRRTEETRLADLKDKRKQEEQKRRAEENRLAELESQSKIAEQRRIREEQRLAELDKKRQRDDAKRERLKLEADARRMALEEEQKRLDAERMKQADSTVVKYIDIITQRVSRNWITPPGVPPGLSCVVRVRLIPGGQVISAQVVTSSGNGLFDRSAETAVRKASPLPVPSEPYIFNQFRNFVFTFKPEGQL